ncbi:MAG: histidine phosphotransferase family protein [Pseudomonadota bacterium]
MTSVDLSATIASRICHDLVSPIGAIVNGVDLIREIGGGDVQDELGMISQSADRASSLLQFYRIAFGASDPEATAIARSTLYDMASRLITTPRVVVEWSDLDGPALTRSEARLLFQMLLCAKLAVAMRGVVLIETGTDQTAPITVTVETGEGAPINNDLTRHYDLALAAEVPARMVEFPLTALSAQEMGLTLDVQAEGPRLTMTVR